MTLVTRYLLKEIARPFVAWTVFLFLLLCAMAFLRGNDVLMGSAVTLGEAVQGLFLLTPPFLAQAAPIAFLLGVFLGFGRMADDGELKALSSLGLRPWRLLSAPIWLGLALSALLVTLSFTLQPYTQRATRVWAQDVIKRNLIGDVKPGVFYDELLGVMLYAEEASPDGHWRHVLLHDEQNPSAPLLIAAREGWVRGGEDAMLEIDLQQGSVHRATATDAQYSVIGFEKSQVRVEVVEALFRKNRFASSRDELSPAQLWRARTDAQARGEPGTQEGLALHWKLGQLLMPLAFAVIGVPLALRKRQGGRALAFMLSLGCYLGYYLLARASISLGDKGVLAPFFAGQLPNLLAVSVGFSWLKWIERRGP